MFIRLETGFWVLAKAITKIEADFAYRQSALVKEYFVRVFLNNDEPRKIFVSDMDSAYLLADELAREVNEILSSRREANEKLSKMLDSMMEI